MALMQLGVKCGETVKVTIEGEDEDVVAPIVEAFFKANF
jgi:phosphocarrier protein